MGYAMLLTNIFKRVKIDLKSKVSGKSKRDFDLITLKRMKLLAIPPSKEFVVMVETMEE